MSNNLKFETYHVCSHTADNMLAFRKLNSNSWQFSLTYPSTAAYLNSKGFLSDGGWYSQIFKSRKEAFLEAKRIFASLNLPLPSEEIKAINSYRLVDSKLPLIKNFIFNKDNSLYIDGKIIQPTRWYISCNNLKSLQNQENFFYSWENFFKDVYFETRLEAADNLLQLVKMI